MKKHSKRLLVAVLTTGMLSQSVLPVMANPVSTKIVETNMAKKASSSDALEGGLGGRKHLDQMHWEYSSIQQKKITEN